MPFSWFFGRAERRRRAAQSRRAPTALFVRRLERRRVLDASISSVVVPMVVAEGETASMSATGTGTGTLSFEWSIKQGLDTIAAGSGDTFDFVPPDDGVYEVHIQLFDSAQTSDVEIHTLTVTNAAPVFETLGITTPIDENGTATLSGTYSDGGVLDTHELDIDWNGDSVFDQTITVSGGSFSVDRQFLDDDPTATASDTVEIAVRLRDDDGASVEATVDLTVNNVAPEITDLTAVDVVENGTTTLSGTIVDPGTQDTFTLQVDWGDGTIETFTYGAGTTGFSETHQYLDDDPSGTTADSYAIEVSIVDDDGGEGTAETSITVSNVAPILAADLTATNTSESGTTTLSGTIIDPGTRDTFTLEVDWGDGTVETFTYGAGTTLFSETHQYLDDDPTTTPVDVYTVNVRLRDDDGGEHTRSLDVRVDNVAPSVENLTANDVLENGVVTLSGDIIDPGMNDTFTLEVDWGDGTVEFFVYAAGTSTFSETHRYLDDDPTGTASDPATISVRLADDDQGEFTDEVTITVTNVAPVAVPAGDRTVDEGAVLDLSGLGGAPFVAFLTDVGTLDTHTATIDWGDGSATEAGVVYQGSGAAAIGSAHIYADDGVYTVTVTVVDDDGGIDTTTFFVTVENVVPTLAVVEPQSVAEGSQLVIPNLGQITDPGFANDANPNGPSAETFSYTIDWGDGMPTETGSATIDAIGGALDPTDASFDGSHTYADNGTYTVTVRIADDDMSGDFAGGIAGIDFIEQTFTVTVSNVDPTLSTSVVEVNEGASFVLSGDGDPSTVDLGVLVNDPGFDNPANAGNVASGGEFEETFTAMTVDWGDGGPVEAIAIDPASRVSGGPGVLTTAAFSHPAHTYADNGTYTVTITMRDDDGGVVSRELMIVVHNVAPDLAVVDTQTRDEAEGLVVIDLGVVTDPGFDNPLNPLAQPGGSRETFTYSIDWGDGTATNGGAATIDAIGSVGDPTDASFDGSHVYADNGNYTVVVRVADDDMSGNFATGVAGIDFVERTFTVVVNNVAPQFEPLSGPPFMEGDNRDRFEGTDVTAEGFTTIAVAFSDPGFDNPLNAGNLSNGGETAETFTYTVDWGDGTVDTIEVIFVAPGVPLVVNAQTSVLTSLRMPGDADARTTGAFAVTHRYTGPPNPLNPTAPIEITLTLGDDDGGTVSATIEVQNPGINTHNVAIDTTPDVPRLETSVPAPAGVFIVSQTTSTESQQTTEVQLTGTELVATAERYFELRVVYPDGRESDGYRLKDEALTDLRALFASLPDGRYRIYLIRTENNSERLVMEVDVRNGRVIDTSDDSEGTRDRPPTSETELEEALPLENNPNLEGSPTGEMREAGAPEGEANMETGAAAATEATTAAPAATGGSDDAPRRVLNRHVALVNRSPNLAAATVASGIALAGGWKSRVSAALEESDPALWRRLRYGGRLRRKLREQSGGSADSGRKKNQLQ